MSLLNYSAAKNRVYVRRFDHDEARARYGAGESIRALANEYGVSTSAVRFALFPDEKLRNYEAVKRWQQGVCESCGGPAMRLVGSKKLHNPDGRTLCAACWAKLRRKPLRLRADGVLVYQCSHCEEWKPLDQFAPRVRRRLEAGENPRRNSGATCRACSTAARQAYRERHKQPCERCGKPALPPNEKGGNGRARDRVLCLDCYRETELPEHSRRAREVLQEKRRNGRPPAVTGEDPQTSRGTEASVA